MEVGERDGHRIRRARELVEFAGRRRRRWRLKSQNPRDREGNAGLPGPAIYIRRLRRWVPRRARPCDLESTVGIFPGKATRASWPLDRIYHPRTVEIRSRQRIEPSSACSAPSSSSPASSQSHGVARCPGLPLASRANLQVLHHEGVFTMRERTRPPSSEGVAETAQAAAVEAPRFRWDALGSDLFEPQEQAMRGLSPSPGCPTDAGR